MKSQIIHRLLVEKYKSHKSFDIVTPHIFIYEDNGKWQKIENGVSEEIECVIIRRGCEFMKTFPNGMRVLGADIVEEYESHSLDGTVCRYKKRC